MRRASPPSPRLQPQPHQPGVTRAWFPDLPPRLRDISPRSTPTPLLRLFAALQTRSYLFAFERHPSPTGKERGDGEERQLVFKPTLHPSGVAKNRRARPFSRTWCTAVLSRLALRAGSGAGAFSRPRAKAGLMPVGPRKYQRQLQAGPSGPQVEKGEFACPSPRRPERVQFGHADAL